MSFSKALKALERQKKLESIFSADTVFSYPVIVRRENTIYDGLFAYRQPEKRKTTTARPFAWMLLGIQDGRVCLASDCMAADFIPTSEYPLDSQISMKLPDSTDASKVGKLTDDLYAVYDELREFAFEENLSRDQVAAIVRYKDLFMQLCPKGLYPFYHSLSPAFFHWLRLPLPERRGPVIAPPEKDEAREYQYQLLILENLQRLVVQFQDKIAVDKHKESLFDDLHKELQSYRGGMLDDLTRHLELDIIQLIDGLRRTMDSFLEAELSEDAKRVAVMLEGVAIDLQDILYRQGIDPYTVPGDDVDTARQTTVTTQQTADKALDRKICTRLAMGWEKGGKIVRPERVSVYVYKG